MNVGYCTNLPSRCSKAAAKEQIEMGTPGARCPECSATLVPQKAGQRGGAAFIVAGVVGVLILAALAVVLFKFVGKSSKPPVATAPTAATQTATVAPTTPVAPTATPAAAPTGTPLMTLSGSNTIGDKLGPMLAEAWLKSVGASNTAIERSGNDEAIVRATLNGSATWIRVKAHGSGDAFKDLESGGADIGMASRAIKPEEVKRLSALGDLTGRASEHVLALDGVAVIVSPGNPIESLKKEQIAQIFTGAVTDWSQVGGSAGRIKVYARDDNSGTFDTFKTLAMRGAGLVGGAQRFEDSKQLEQSVAQDPLGIGFVGLPFVKTAKPVAVSDGGLPLAPTGFTVRREDYPLSRRLFLYIPAAPQNPKVNEFVNFALSPAGQQVVRSAGFFDLDLNKPAEKPAATAPATDNARCRLSESWRGDREEYCKLNAVAQVLETNFRFKTGSYDLDNRAFRDLRRVLEWLEKNPGKQIVLVGFADAQGAYAANVALSNKRAATVADALKTLGVPGTGIALQGFGPELAVADNGTDEGREKNRRVEIFAR